MKTSSKVKSSDNPQRNTPPLGEQGAATQALTAAMPFNAGKAQDFGRQNAYAPPRGASVPNNSPTVSASTLSEPNVSARCRVE